MKVITEAMLAAYLVTDPILEVLHDESRPSDRETYGCHRWLLESEPKRHVFHLLYGDLLKSSVRKKVLDVGGGYSAISRRLRRAHDYRVLDFMAHDSREAVCAEESEDDQPCWIDGDWALCQLPGQFDVVVANDLFPNVDQRLECFLERYLPQCDEVRLALTYYDQPRWYKVKRVDGDEIFHMLAWDGAQVRRVLEPFVDRIVEPALDALLETKPTVYSNGRQVCLVTLKGRTERGELESSLGDRS